MEIQNRREELENVKGKEYKVQKGKLTQTDYILQEKKMQKNGLKHIFESIGLVDPNEKIGFSRIEESLVSFRHVVKVIYWMSSSNFLLNLEE